MVFFLSFFPLFLRFPWSLSNHTRSPISYSRRRPCLSSSYYNSNVAFHKFASLPPRSFSLCSSFVVCTLRLNRTVWQLACLRCFLYTVRYLVHFPHNESLSHAFSSIFEHVAQIIGLEAPLRLISDRLTVHLTTARILKNRLPSCNLSCQIHKPSHTKINASWQRTASRPAHSCPHLRPMLARQATKTGMLKVHTCHHPRLRFHRIPIPFQLLLPRHWVATCHPRVLEDLYVVLRLNPTSAHCMLEAWRRCQPVRKASVD